MCHVCRHLLRGDLVRGLVLAVRLRDEDAVTGAVVLYTAIVIGICLHFIWRGWP